jgi:hypothetical protein
MDLYNGVTDPDLDLALRQWLSRCQLKISFFILHFFDFYFLKVHLHQSSKINSHKTVEMKVFLTIFA